MLFLSAVLLCLFIDGNCVPAQYPMMVEDQPADEIKGSGVKFTRPDGTPIYVNPRAVAFVRAPLKSEHGNATIVFTSGAVQSTEETVEQVIRGISLDKPIHQYDGRDDPTGP